MGEKVDNIIDSFRLCDDDRTTTPEEVYNLEDGKRIQGCGFLAIFVTMVAFTTAVISNAEMQELTTHAETLVHATKDDVLKWKDESKFVF